MDEDEEFWTELQRAIDNSDSIEPPFEEIDLGDGPEPAK